MSGVFGIFNRNGKPADKEIVDNMLEVMSSWNPDEKNLCIEGPIALGHSMLWNTPESKYEHLPLENNEYILTMDARIDNREELVNELELPDRPLNEIGDSEFILGAYKKWGEECPKHLLGDYTFAIWDKKKEQLFCARDYIGVKQFYYYMDDEKFIFSNEIKVLLVCKEIEFTYDENTIAKYLRPDYIVEHDCTFYKNIKKLLPARTMSVRKNDVKEYIYWRLEESPKIRYENIDEYINIGRKLLEEAVYCRIRSPYPIASHLSGGLDSSSIAVLASRRLAESGQNLTGYNWIPVLDGSDNGNYYEWNNSKKIALLENIEHKAMDLSAKDVSELFKIVNVMYGDTLHFWYEFPIQKDANQKNIRVILSGTGGDQFISHPGRARKVRLSWLERLKKLHRLMVFESSGYGEIILKYIKKFSSSIFYRTIPHWLICIYNGSYCSYKVPKYIQPRMTGKMRKLRSNIRQTHKKTIRNSMLINFYEAALQTRFESWEVSGKLNKIEYRYPLLDRRLVEFAFGVPENIFHYSNQERFLFRHMIENLLPEEITWSNTKSEPKRVRKIIEITKNSLKLWRDSYYDSDQNCKYFEFNELLRELDGENSNNYDIITTIVSSIILIEFCKKEKNAKRME